MSAAPRDTDPDIHRLERTIRRRWRERGVAGPAPAGERFALQTWTGDDRHRDARAAALVATDVVARHRTMLGSAVDLVADRAGDGLREQLACVAPRRTVDVADAAYVDSVWWSLAQLWDAGLLHESPHDGAWCPACQTWCESDQVRTGAIDGIAALVRFPVVGDNALAHAGASLLVDVPAPWVLPAVTAVATAQDGDLVLAQAAGDGYPVVVARAAVSRTLGPEAVVHRDVASDEVAGVAYRPPVVVAGTSPAGRRDVVVVVDDARATTGFVPVAPTVAAADLWIADDHDLATVDVLGRDGRWTAEVAAYAGSVALDGDEAVVADLDGRGLVVRATPVPREIDHCGRCGAAVLRRARRSWFVATTRARDRVDEEHAAVDRCPDDQRHGWATADRDWSISIAHGDGAPLPVWRCGGCGWTAVVSGRAQLAALAGLDEGDGIERRAVLACTVCSGTARRLPLAIDPRYTAGCLPFARFGFPHVDGSDALVAAHARSDLLVDAGDPDAGWTDAALVIATMLWDAAGHDAELWARVPPVGAGSDASTDTRGIDAIGVDASIDAYGIDATRWALLGGGGPAAAPLRALRAVCVTLAEQARLHGWTIADTVRAPDVADRDVLHRWVLAALADTVERTGDALTRFDVATAVDRLEAFVGDLVWYLGRTAEGPGDDRGTDLATAHECVVTVAGLLAPLTPMVADQLYELLVRADDPGAPPSIHCLRYPTADPAAVDVPLRAAIAAARRLAELGVRARTHAGLAADASLPQALVAVPAAAQECWDEVAVLAGAWLGVEAIHRVDRMPLPGAASEGWLIDGDGIHHVALDVGARTGRSEQLARDVISAVHALRRERTLDADQPITVRIDADPEIAAAVEVHRQVIADDVLATRIELGPIEHGVAVPLGDSPARVALREAVAR